MFDQIIDWAVTYIECVVMLAAVTTACGKKYSGKKGTPLVFGAASVHAILIALLNSISAFSFITPLFSIAYLFTAAWFLSNGNWMLRASASVIILFVILSIDYMLMITVCTLYGGEFQLAFEIFMSPGFLRTGYLFLNKAVDIAFFCVIRKQLPRLSRLRRRWLTALLAASIAMYWIMQHLFNVILSGDHAQLQSAFIFFFFFLLCFMVVVLMLVVSMAATESERTENKLLQNTNQLMEENYQALHQDLQMNAKMIHDFHHHLRAIRGMAEREKKEELLAYIDSILSASYREMSLCHSGNDVIDAVINCNAEEAKRKDIPFYYDVDLLSPLDIDPVDICALLANQIENAIEASEKIPNADDRFVKVDITQHGDFVVFTVKNAALENPFDAAGKLVSKKARQGRAHGFGLQNIRDVAAKYNGQVSNKYADGAFVSVVMVENRQFNT